MEVIHWEIKKTDQIKQKVNQKKPVQAPNATARPDITGPIDRIFCWKPSQKGVLSFMELDWPMKKLGFKICKISGSFHKATVHFI